MASDVHVDSPCSASASPDRVPIPRLARAPVPPLDRAADPCPGPDAPVRVEVEMPRDLYDRLTSCDDAPRCRYDMATGRAEFVAEPGVGHERRAAAISSLFSRIEDALEDAGHPLDLLIAAATRLLSDDGAFEPDASLFLDPMNTRSAVDLEDYLDMRKGHPMPDLVAEIDRSVNSSHKLMPYFRMGGARGVDLESARRRACLGGRSGIGAAIPGIEPEPGAAGSRPGRTRSTPCRPYPVRSIAAFPPTRPAGRPRHAREPCNRLNPKRKREARISPKARISTESRR